MKTKRILIAVICMLVVVIIALSAALIMQEHRPDISVASIRGSITPLVEGLPNIDDEINENDVNIDSTELIGNDKLVYNLIITASYYFKAPSQVRLVSGCIIDNADNTRAVVRLQSMNSFGAITASPYLIADGGNFCLDVDTYFEYKNNPRYFLIGASELFGTMNYSDSDIENYLTYNGEVLSVESIVALYQDTESLNAKLINDALEKAWIEKLGI